MLRRVVSHARRLGIERSVMEPIIDVVVERFGDAYPELRENEAFIRQVAGSEEERFAATLRQGLVLFEDAKDSRRGGAHHRRGCVQALRHVRVPVAAHRGARRGGGAHGRQRPVRPAAGGAAGPRPRRREEGPDRPGRGRGPAVDVRRLRPTGRRRDDRVVAGSRVPRAAGGRGRRGGSGASSTAPRSTRRAEDRSATEG